MVQGMVYFCRETWTIGCDGNSTRAKWGPFSLCLSQIFCCILEHDRAVCSREEEDRDPQEHVSL